MKLLIVSGSPLEQSGDYYYAYDTWLRLVQHLNDEFGSVTLFSPVKARDERQHAAGAWRLNRDSIAVAPHDYFNSFASYYRRWPHLQRKLRRQLDELVASHDLVLLRTPSPMLMLVMRAARRHRKQVVMMVLGNLATQAAGLVTETGLKWLAYKTAVTVAVLQEMWCGRYAAELIVYSREIARRHRLIDSQPKLMQDPTLSMADIVPREDTCQNDDIRLVRVSWLIPSKGIETLIDAVAILRRNGMNAVLDIVGHERTAGYEQKLRARVANLGLDDAVRFRGWVPTDLIKNVYLESDIQVISSLSEGTPRCIVEGFARGVPLVCTAVGGCADILEDGKNALLVTAGDSESMAVAIRRVVEDGELRRQLIRGGYATAHEATFETLGARFVSLLRDVATGGPSLLLEASDLRNV